MQRTNWNYKDFTVRELEKLIDDCFNRAGRSRVTLSKKGGVGTCYGLVKDGNDIIFLKEYTDGFDFINTAHMFVDFHFVLKHVEKVSIATRNGGNRRYGDIQGELNMCYRIYQVNDAPPQKDYGF